MFFRMAILRLTKKTAAINRVSQQEYLRNNFSRQILLKLTRSISHKFEENEGRVTKEASQEFKRTKSRILSALSKLDEIHMKSYVLVQSGIVSGISRDINREIQEFNEDRSRIYPHLEVDETVIWSLYTVIPDPYHCSSKVI